MKKNFKKYFPKFFVLFYHYILAVLANIIYRFPSRKLIVIGVTGTNGKTTTSNLIWQILTAAGFTVGLTTSINFKVGQKSWVNRTKQGMQGRLKLQKLLRQMVQAGCQYAVIETTSEGIKQHRHWGILYDIAVFTNLTPEHIEAHGSWERYKQAKGKLFQALKQQNLLVTLFFCDKRRSKKVSVVNLDDNQSEFFLSFAADEKLGYMINKPNLKNSEHIKKLSVEDYQLSASGTNFKVRLGSTVLNFKTMLLGEFNIYNCLAATAVGLSQGIPLDKIRETLAKTQPVAGRMEVIRDITRQITVIVDYAHDPAALQNVYETITGTLKDKHESKMIAVLGAVGGGRDKAKRPKLGLLAAKYAKYVIITNEDPYDDDPQVIIDQVEVGVRKNDDRKLNENYWKILDRRKAIQKAVTLAQPNDIIVLTGKGCEEVMAVEGKFIPWDDRQVVREILALN